MPDSRADFPSAFANHLAFLSRHRGLLEEDAGGTWINGRIPELTSWTPRADDSATPPACPAVRLAPWCGPHWDARLAGAGFARGETLVYMALADPTRPIPHDGSTRVEAVSDEAGSLEFARVQNLGFATGSSTVDAWWAGFFREQALVASRDPDQTLLLGRRGEVAVGTTLALRAAGVLGIYAVTTLPDQRRQGVSAALLDHVRRACAGPGRIILQAMAGSYAEQYYARLGFNEVGRLSVWRREQS